MSLEKSPPSRYRIEERDRVLVTIDTWSGSTIGGHAQPQPPQRTNDPGAAPASAGQPSRAARKASALAPSAGMRQGNNIAANQIKLIGLVIGILIAAGFLIATNLWVVLAIGLVVPQSRGLLVGLAKTILAKALGNQP